MCRLVAGDGVRAIGFDEGGAGIATDVRGGACKELCTRGCMESIVDLASFGEAQEFSRLFNGEERLAMYYKDKTKVTHDLCFRFLHRSAPRED